jgi:hypothetical protein
VARRQPGWSGRATCFETVKPLDRRSACCTPCCPESGSGHLRHLLIRLQQQGWPVSPGCLPEIIERTGLILRQGA